MQREALRPPRPKAPHLMDESIPAMVWCARPDMSCEYLSRAWLDFTGCDEAQALGDGWSRGVHPEDLARWLDACVRAFDARDPFDIEYRLRRRDGEYRWVHEHGVPRISPDGVFVGYAGCCFDVHERRGMEAELARALERERRLRTATEEAGRVRDRFLSTVLGDLRSPLQAIAAWARHLRLQVGTGEAGRTLHAIENNAATQDRLISDLLDLSRAGGEALPRHDAGAPLLAGVRVLVVDGDAAALEGVMKVLEIAGAETRAARSCAEALEALKGFHADVLLSDVTAGRSEGLSLIRALRALPAEEGGCMRAAALTPPAHPEDGVRAVAAGYDAQLAKPIEPVALLAAMVRLTRPAAA
jgi:PAS domain S-box-containing protein